MPGSIKTRIMHKTDSRENWESAELSGKVLLNGEIAFVRAGGDVWLKIGDGSSPFAALPYVETPALSGKQDVLVGTRESWAADSSFVPRPGQIVVWADGGELSGTSVPRLKVGDGNAYNLDLPFVGDDRQAEVMAALAEHAASASHLSAGERERWEHKITIGDLADPSSDGVVGETLVITRN